jgi:hypothetical protein
LHQAAGRRAQAANAFHQGVAIIERLPRLRSDNLYDLACYHAILSSALDRQNPGSSAAADQAMRRLREAVAAGYRNIEWMRRDTDLDPLRSRLDFQLLMMDLAMPDDSFAR